jgi:hypothetical protein
VPDLEARVAALEATVVMLTRKLLQSGDISINDARSAHGLPPFPGPWAGTAGYVQPEPDFMTRTTAEPLHGTEHLKIRLTHTPTGIMVVARDRAEAVHKLRKALAGHAARQYDLQEAERRRQGKGTPPPRRPRRAARKPYTSEVVPAAQETPEPAA